jgi:tyrosyl-tRNA synthetase
VKKTAVVNHPGYETHVKLLGRLQTQPARPGLQRIENHHRPVQQRPKALEAEQQQDPGKRPMQKALAKDITCRVHSLADYEAAVAASEILFGKSTDEDLRKLSGETLMEIFEGVPQGNVGADELSAGLSIVDAMVKSGFMKSNGEARRALQEGSISVNKVKVDAERMLATADVLAGGVVLMQRGKKNYFLLRVGV